MHAHGPEHAFPLPSECVSTHRIFEVIEAANKVVLVQEYAEAGPLAQVGAWVHRGRVGGPSGQEKRASRCARLPLAHRT